MYTIDGLEVPECLCLLLSRGTQHVCKHVASKEDSDKDSKPVATAFLFVSDSVLPVATDGQIVSEEQSALLFLIINSKLGKSGKIKPSKCILNCRNFVYPCFCFHSVAPPFMVFQGEREKKQEKKGNRGRGSRRDSKRVGGEGEGVEGRERRGNSALIFRSAENYTALSLSVRNF